MKKLLLTCCFSALTLMLSAQLHNPVIPGFHPDPSVCRVGNDFYLVNSSFQYFPGVPIFHSKDLVNWQQIGNVLDRDSQLPLQGATSWQGIYAPTIRYHKGIYYMITTNVANGGNFMVTATNPAGPWSEPIWLEQQGIDPSLYFENGKCYMVSNPDNTIMLCEIDPTTGKQLTKSKALWQGTGGRYPEGPHLYKKDGYYYLLISEGGTEMAHRLTIARSKKIDGPYVANPANPLLTNCSLAGQYLSIQGTGHGDFVQAPDGSWWVVFLAYRNYEGAYHHLGRETCLAPVEWKKGQWPVINGGQPVDTLMQVKTLAPQRPRNVVTRDVDWLHIQNPIRANYQRMGNGFRLKASAGTLTNNQQPTFMGRRQENAVFTMETEINTDSLGFGCKAGLTVYQINDGHMDVGLVKYMTGTVAVVMNYTVKSLQGEVMGDDSGQINGRIRLRISSNGAKYRFEYAGEGQSWKLLGEHDCPLVSTEMVGGFTGAIVGMFAEGEGSADFSYFNYSEK
jgi:alpha-N-arabinofuranosidase